MVAIGPIEADQKQFNGEGIMISKMLVLLCGALIFQGYVFAETWEDRAANKVAWSAEFPDDPACWNPPVGWNTDNPWIVGKGYHEAYSSLANCFRVCAENDTCYRDDWRDDIAGSVTCEVRGPVRQISGVPWWKGTLPLNSIWIQVEAQTGDPRLHILAWCE